MAETVTLVSPDGRRYSTDDTAEATTLITAHGYQRASQDTAQGGYAPDPSPVINEPTQDEDPTSSYLDREDQELDQ